MSKPWWNQYVGIPYVTCGRDRAGVDCWGLVRLVLAEQFGQVLPSFDGAYADGRDVNAIEELGAQRAEAWQRHDGEPQPGDVVLFRVMGRLAHVGVAIGGGLFLHAREGHAVTIERLSAGSWKHRVEGFYRYAAAAVRAGTEAVMLAAVPHPLRTQRIDGTLPAGMTLADVAERVRASGTTRMPHDVVLMLDGRPIAAELWPATRTEIGQRVEYRAVPRGSTAGRIIATIAIMVVAWYAAPLIAGAMGFAAGTTAFGIASAAAGAAINVVGGMLVNAIFPVRPPKIRNPGGAERQLFLQGGANRAAPYEAIPVVLGRFRYTPPVGMMPYTESTSSTSYLRTLLVWGYGKLQVSDLRVGDTPLSSLTSCEVETIDNFDETAAQIDNFNRLQGSDVAQEIVDLKLLNNETDGNPWISRVIDEECNRITVTLHFPEGLRRLVGEGSNAGKVDPAAFRGEIEIRQLDPATKAPLSGWTAYNQLFPGQYFRLQPAFFNIDNDGELEPCYQWTRYSLDSRNRVIVRTGAFTNDPNAEPAGSLLRRQQEAAFGFNATFARLPAYGEGEIPLWDICVRDNIAYQAIDKRPTDGTLQNLAAGSFAIVWDGALLAFWMNSGEVRRVQEAMIQYGAENEPYYKRKNAFTASISFNVPQGYHEVRVRRTNSDARDYTYPSGNKGANCHDAYLAAITAYANARPVTAPKGVKLAMTALRVKATNQLNGNMEGVTGTAQGICLDYDRTNGVWIERATRNPASLMRYVLQHPGNAQRVPDASLDLPALQDFHDWCRTNGFTFDMLITSQMSVDDVLRDICAAGRASYTMRDGKYTVIIDRPRTAIAQHFTPHNSWGFEGTRTLPKLPHAFRVTFYNAEKGYQLDEMIVYNDGYSAANATLFEALELPGVTSPKQVFRAARFHLAQIKLRPETYVLNADIEHLVCTRGDLVRVTHDVPMWGLGTGRVKERTLNASSQLVALALDEEQPMDAGKQYTIRVRSANGASSTFTVAAKPVDGWYTDLAIVAGSRQGSYNPVPGDLFMFGELGEESVELIVQSIEPAGNLTARITLVDYAPAIYDSDTETIPAFDSQITLPPALLLPTITAKPTIGRIVSDETVMQQIAPGQFAYAIKVAYANPKGLSQSITHIEGQIDYALDASLDWQASRIFKLSDGHVLFDGVDEADTYRVRLRYVDRDGRAGPWASPVTHTVVGKKNPPAAVKGASIRVSGTRYFLDWGNNEEIDIKGYEVRRVDANWGSSSGRAYKGATSSCYVDPMMISGTETFYIKAYDYAGNYSKVPATVSYAMAVPSAPASATATFNDTSTTNAQVLVNWPDVATPFGLSHYECTLTLPAGTSGGTSRTFKAKTSEWLTAANWKGDATFAVKTVDRLGRFSAARTITITKSVPANVSATGLTKTTKGATVTLNWNDVAKTTLPVAGYEVRPTDAGWGTKGFLYRGVASLCTLPMAQGTNVFYIKAYDTDGNYSATALQVQQVYDPPANVNGVTLARSGANIAMTCAAAEPADLKHFEWRIKKVVVAADATNDAWNSYDVALQTTGKIASWRPSALGQYRVSVRMVDREGNVSAASVSANITLSKIAAP